MVAINKFILTFSVLLSTLILATGATAMADVKYVLKLRTENAKCIVFVNEMEAVSSMWVDSGTISTGLDTTAYVENGSNSLSVWFGPAGDQAGTYDFVKPSKCLVTIEAQSPSKSLIISNIIIEANKNVPPSAQNSIHYEGGDLTSKVIEGKVPNFNAYQANRIFDLKQVPKWAWTTATPFTPTAENMQKLRDAYMKIWLAMDKKSIDGMKRLMDIDISEEAQNEGVSKDLFFSTYDFDHDFKTCKGAVKIDFSKYSLKSYRGGRLIQLQDENDDSPLKLRRTNSDTHELTSYNPFLSLINGQIVITR